MIVLTSTLLSICRALGVRAGVFVQALLNVLAPALCAQPGLASAGFQAEPPAAATAGTDFVFQPGASVPALQIPRGERLTYRAYVDLSVVSTSVGVVTQTTTVEEQRPSVLLVQPQESAAGDVATVTLHAEGGYAWYDVESTIQTKILPQEWPRIVYSTESKGSERRRREIYLGRQDGAPTSSYRRDTEKGAPEGTRIWREAKLRPVPEGTLDMLTSLFMARTLIREGSKEITFPLIDKDRVWLLRLTKGKERRMETPAGIFNVVQVVLEPGPHPGEQGFEEERLRRFEGVFGIQGTIQLWVERHTGVAVRIQGDLPAGPLTLGIDVILDSYSGTPREFAPVPADDEK